MVGQKAEGQGLNPRPQPEHLGLGTLFLVQPVRRARPDVDWSVVEAVVIGEQVDQLAGQVLVVQVADLDGPLLRRGERASGLGVGEVGLDAGGEDHEHVPGRRRTQAHAMIDAAGPPRPAPCARGAGCHGQVDRRNACVRGDGSMADLVERGAEQRRVGNRLSYHIEYGPTVLPPWAVAMALICQPTRACWR
ncbi:hypothetical protein ABUW04_07130 [Streptacidiphilus sp. N1-10]|uniref:Uncharacterized protein n=1 Tax=Streptacidiphilus jeojiensis TaxID=3229225 RepID=A0ABV6XIX7_9ACTN